MSDSPRNNTIATKPISRLRRTVNFAKAYNEARNGHFTAARNTLTSNGKVIKPYGIDITNPTSFRENRQLFKRYLNNDITQYRRVGGNVRMVV